MNMLEKSQKSSFCGSKLQGVTLRVRKALVTYYGRINIDNYIVS